LGILKTINRSYEAENDLEAIKLALKPGVTGRTRKPGGSEFNAGAGLFFTKSIATVGRNYFMLYSGTGLYKLLKTKHNTEVKLVGDPLASKHKVANDLPFWQGTVVGIDISLNIDEDFNNLLELIRKAYSLDVDERKRANYKKPIFL
jgi:hypothetical protein